MRDRQRLVLHPHNECHVSAVLHGDVGDLLYCPLLAWSANHRRGAVLAVAEEPSLSREG